MEVIGVIKGIRDIREHSAAKDLMAQHPDYASNPEVIDKIGAINPDAGNQLRASLPNALKLREERAASGAIWAQRALGASMRAYQGALNKSEEGESPTDANFADADKAAQDMWGRYRSVMKQKGYAVDQLLPPVWNLRDQARLEGEYGAITDAMRQPYNVVKPDGSAETMFFLPGEDSTFAAEMKKGGQPVRIEKLGTAAAAKTADQKALDANQRATITGKVGDDYVKQSEDFITADKAYRDMVSLAQQPTGPNDFAMLYRFNKLLDPRSVVRENEFAAAANQGSLPAATMNWLTKFKNGELVGETREQFLNAAQTLYRERERDQNALDKGLGFAQSAFKLNDDEMAAIRGRVPRIEAAPRKTAEAPPGAEPAPTPERVKQIDQAKAILADPKATPEAFSGALRQLPQPDLLSVNRNALSDANLKSYVEELKRRKAAAQRPAKKPAKGGP